MRSPRRRSGIHAVALISIGLLPALGQDPPRPRTVITPILHTGDPAPGIPNATIGLLTTPQIDAAGNVLVWGGFAFDGSPTLFAGMWYGGPGTVDVVAYYGMQAPDLPDGVLLGSFFSGGLSESGWFAYTGFLTGPGIVPSVNDKAVFVGPPGDLRVLLQGGDQAPGLEPGTIIDVTPFLGFGAGLSDQATLLVFGWLAGPGVDETNDRVVWVGTRDKLEVIWREGMEAPGTGGARFAFASFVRFNDNGEIAFLGALINEPGIDHTNDSGIWAGRSGKLQLVWREGEQAWGLPDGVLHEGGGGVAGLNKVGDVAFWTRLRGNGVTAENDHAIWVKTEDRVELIGRKGDPVPDIGPDVELDSIGSEQTNARREIFYRVKYRGEGVDPSNEWAMHFGPFDNPEQTLRDGEPAPNLPASTLLTFVGIGPGLAAMNEVGDIITGSEITGPDVTEQNKVVVWCRDLVRTEWFPLLRSGVMVEDRVVFIPGAVDLSGAYWNKTGGSDGERQSFNDAGQLAINLKFTDGSHGVFVLQLAWPGDGDGDRDVDLKDFAFFQTCFVGSNPPIVEGCKIFDFDQDGDVDLLDYDGFLQAVTGPE